MTSQDELKRQAASAAVDHVESGMVLGLGSGSTATFALQRIAERMRAGDLDRIVGIPSSIRTEALAKELGIALTSFDEHPAIDVTIDGADEVDPELNLIKGGGGALLREKVLAQASRQNIIIVDETKISPRLGTKWAVPIEVIPFARMTEEKFLIALGANVTVRRTADGSPYRTDQQNIILDANFGPMNDPREIAARLNERAGIVEHGLFLSLATEVIIAAQDGIRHLKR
jgi:ribose 5-phosphate isomerase A